MTILEHKFREQYNPELIYPGSFVIYYIERIVYPEANFLIFVIPTMVIAVFCLIMYIVRPPDKIKKICRIGRTESRG